MHYIRIRFLVNRLYSWLCVLLQFPVSDPNVILDGRKVLLLHLHVLVEIGPDKGVPIVLRLWWLSPDCAKTGSIEIEDIVLDTTASHGVFLYREPELNYARKVNRLQVILLETSGSMMIMMMQKAEKWRLKECSTRANVLQSLMLRVNSCGVECILQVERRVSLVY